MTTTAAGTSAAQKAAAIAAGLTAHAIAWVFLTRASDGTRAVMSEARAARLVDSYCVDCHDDLTKTANLSLDGADYASLAENAEHWEPVRRVRAP